VAEYVTPSTQLAGPFTCLSEPLKSTVISLPATVAFTWILTGRSVSMPSLSRKSSKV